MKQKSIVEGLILIILFFGSWYVLGQIDWVHVLKVEGFTDKTEQKLGNLFLEVFKNSDEEITDPPVVDAVDSILVHICEANKINKDKIKIHLLANDQVNAFALPDGHLVIYSGLISKADNQEELIGVICHEVAHIQLNHVMKKLVKEIGLSVLVSITTGGAGSDIILESTQLLSSSAYDRTLEKQADIQAVDYLIQAKVNPNSVAEFLYKLSGGDGEQQEYLSWLSTHPDSRKRAEYIIEYAKKGKERNYQPILSNTSWARLKEATFRQM